jgi:hypothetical protein
VWSNQQELAPQTRCYLIANRAWDEQGESMNEECGRLRRDNNLEKANKAIDDNKVVHDTFKIASNTYTLAQGYNCTCELMNMKWCTWYGAMQNAMMQCHQLLVDWARIHDTSNNIGMTGSNGKSPNFWARSSQSLKGKKSVIEGKFCSRSWSET